MSSTYVIFEVVPCPAATDVLLPLHSVYRRTQRELYAWVVSFGSKSESMTMRTTTIHRETVCSLAKEPLTVNISLLQKLSTNQGCHKLISRVKSYN